MRERRGRANARLVMVALLVAGLGFGACARGPADVSLADLAADQETYDGRVVVTEGTVRHITEGTRPHHVLEDEAQNRVLLVPDDLAARHRGERIEVRGQFRFDPERGRTLQVEELEVLP